MAEDVSTDEQSARGIDDLLEEWMAEWLNTLERQVYELHHRRQIHDEFMAMLDSQDHPDTSIFQDAFHRMYVESQVLAIRRQADSDSRTLSLRRLIGQVEQRRKDFTRSWYVGRWMRDRDPNSEALRERHLARFHLDQANAAFDKFTDEPGAELLGGRRLRDDRDELEAMTDKVVRYANAVVAHAERNPEEVEVTYDDFNNAIDHLGEMLCRYFLLLSIRAACSARAPRFRGTGRVCSGARSRSRGRRVAPSETV